MERTYITTDEEEKALARSLEKSGSPETPEEFINRTIKERLQEAVWEWREQDRKAIDNKIQANLPNLDEAALAKISAEVEALLPK